MNHDVETGWGGPCPSHVKDHVRETEACLELGSLGAKAE